MKTLFFVMALTSVPMAFGQSNVAVVKVLRGDVDILTLGKTEKLKVDEWVNEGAVIKTAEKSFVKLVFIDKSQMNVGPKSEMKIEKFVGNDSGVIDLVKGKIRSQVTKDYLQQQDKGKSKLFIKTPNAVMGIRGTDFMISTNGANTSAFLFEGEVVFNKLDTPQAVSSNNLETMVNSGVRMQPGEFSVMDSARLRPTEPAVLNIQQMEKLEKNVNFEEKAPEANSAATKSVVPAGLNGQVVSNNPEVLKNEVGQTTTMDTTAVKPTGTAAQAEGFVNGDIVKPANGSFVHVESGIIIPPGPGSVLDTNTNSYIPAPGQGQVNANGDYVPPKNVEITDDGKILVTVKNEAGKTTVQEIEKPKPIASSSGTTLGGAAEVIQKNPTLVNAAVPVSNDILNKSFAPSGLTDLTNIRNNTSGGIHTVNDAVQQKPTTPVTITPRNGDK